MFLEGVLASQITPFFFRYWFQIGTFTNYLMYSHMFVYMHKQSQRQGKTLYSKNYNFIILIGIAMGYNTNSSQYKNVSDKFYLKSHAFPNLIPIIELCRFEKKKYLESTHTSTLTKYIPEFKIKSV